MRCICCHLGHLNRRAGTNRHFMSPIYSRQLMYTVIIQISNNFKVQLDLYDPFSVEQALSCVSKQLYVRILAGLSIRALKC